VTVGASAALTQTAPASSTPNILLAPITVIVIFTPSVLNVKPIWSDPRELEYAAAAATNALLTTRVAG
jgi:hypothetical protein